MSCAVQQVQPVAATDGQQALPAAQSKRRKKPRKKDVLGQANTNADDLSTTVMIQGLPWTYKEGDLLKLLNQVIGPGSFDFFYMPWNVKRNTNSGCAFVNFTTSINAVKCAALLYGHTFECQSKTIKPCMVVPAHVQGLVKNVEYYRYRAVGTAKCPHAPMVFKDGVRINFQMAVEKLCPKKSKKGRVPTNGEDLTKASEGKEQPDINIVNGFQNTQRLTSRSHPGLQLEGFMEFDTLDSLENDALFKSILRPMDEDPHQIPLPSFSCLRQQDDVVRPRSDCGTSTSASEDERSMFGNCTRQLMYGNEDEDEQARQDFLNEDLVWADLHPALNEFQLHSF